jgi:hypothetical protein
LPPIVDVYSLYHTRYVPLDVRSFHLLARDLILNPLIICERAFVQDQDSTANRAKGADGVTLRLRRHVDVFLDVTDLVSVVM